MHRRSFLMFLGTGMAASALTPGQLIAEVSRTGGVAIADLNSVVFYDGAAWVSGWHKFLSDTNYDIYVVA